MGRETLKKYWQYNEIMIIATKKQQTSEGSYEPYWKIIQEKIWIRQKNNQGQQRKRRKLIALM